VHERCVTACDVQAHADAEEREECDVLDARPRTAHGPTGRGGPALQSAHV